MPFLGELAALGTSIGFSIGSTLFTIAGRAVGTGVVNRVRLALALIFTLVLHKILVGTFYPLNLGVDVYFWMALSGLVGFVIGDAFLFQGFVMVGPRLSMLMMALAPVLSTIMAFVFLQEVLSPIKILGIVITMIGIAVVVGEPQKLLELDDPQEPIEDPLQPTINKVQNQNNRNRTIGLLFAFGGAVGQAGGSLLSKIGLASGVPAISGNAIRLTASVIVIWVWAILQRQVGITIKAVQQNHRAMGFIVLATIAGPVIGVWLALISVQLAPLGVVTTLQSLPPIFLIPIGYVVFKERVTRQALLGTAIALAGSAILFF